MPRTFARKRSFAWNLPGNSATKLPQKEPVLPLSVIWRGPKNWKAELQAIQPCRRRADGFTIAPWTGCSGRTVGDGKTKPRPVCLSRGFATEREVWVLGGEYAIDLPLGF